MRKKAAVEHVNTNGSRHVHYQKSDGSTQVSKSKGSLTSVVPNHHNQSTTSYLTNTSSDQFSVGEVWQGSLEQMESEIEKELQEVERLKSDSSLRRALPPKTPATIPQTVPEAGPPKARRSVREKLSAKIAPGFKVKEYASRLKKKMSVWFDKGVEGVRKGKDTLARGLTRTMTQSMSSTKSYGSEASMNSSASSSTQVQPFDNKHLSDASSCTDADGRHEIQQERSSIDDEVQRMIDLNNKKASKVVAAQPLHRQKPSHMISVQAPHGVKDKKDLSHDHKDEFKKDALDQRNYLCWHETDVDVIIAFQLYELLQTKWRFHAKAFLDDPHEAEAEIIADMIQNRNIIKEERIADSKYTVAYKAKLIQRILAAVRGDIEDCLLVENNFRTYLNITLGANPHFDADKNVKFIATHPELKDSYHALKEPSFLHVSDELLEEYVKPEIEEKELDEMREMFDALVAELYPFGNRGAAKTIRIHELRQHPDYGILDLDIYELGSDPTIGFDGFTAMCCSEATRTTGTITRVIMQKIKRSLEQVKAEVSTGHEIDLEQALNKYSDDPLKPTLPQEGHDLYLKIYDLVDWNSGATELSRLMQLFLNTLFSDDECEKHGLIPRVPGSLTFTEFEGLMIPSSYKRSAHRAKPTHHRRCLVSTSPERAMSSFSPNQSEDQNLHHLQAVAGTVLAGVHLRNSHVGSQLPSRNPSRIETVSSGSFCGKTLHGAAEAIVATNRVQHLVEGRNASTRVRSPSPAPSPSITRTTSGRAPEQKLETSNSQGRHQPKQHRGNAAPSSGRDSATNTLHPAPPVSGDKLAPENAKKSDKGSSKGTGPGHAGTGSGHAARGAHAKAHPVPKKPDVQHGPRNQWSPGCS